MHQRLYSPAELLSESVVVAIPGSGEPPVCEGPCPTELQPRPIVGFVNQVQLDGVSYELSLPVRGCASAPVTIALLS